MARDVVLLHTFDEVAAGARAHRGEHPVIAVDPATGRVASRYAIDPVPSGGSLLVVGNTVWTSAFDDATVYEVDGGAG
jgi:hypothetical protein